MGPRWNRIEKSPQWAATTARKMTTMTKTAPCECSTTPTSEESRIPRRLTCQPPPNKRKASKRYIIIDQLALIMAQACVVVLFWLPMEELISAVDVPYKDMLIFTKLQEMETVTSWFRCSPFRIDLLDSKEVIPTLISYPDGDGACAFFFSVDMTLSWILIDPNNPLASKGVKNGFPNASPQSMDSRGQAI
nr:probable F-box protein At2g36090 [Ipomoea batatas]